MKILIVDNSATIVNQDNHFTNNLNGLFLSDLKKSGNELTYLQFTTPRADSISVYNLEVNGIRCVELNSNKNKLLRYLLSIPTITKQIKLSDFIYLYYPNTLRLTAFLCRLFNKPYGLYIRGMNGLNDKTSLTIYRHAYTVLTVSDYFTNMVNNITHKDSAHTIRPMIPYTDADVIKGRNYESKDVYNILFLGRVAKDKGLEELLNAMRQLRDKGYLFKLRIVGNGEYFGQTERLVADLDLKTCVYLEGPVYDDIKKADYYKNADLYVLPTYHEGFPRTLYEAMIFGTPIITTFVGGIPALMKDGENCKRIEPKSAESIAEALAYAMDNYENMGSMAKNATELVAKVVDHNRPTHARQLFDIIKDYGK